MNKLIKKIHAYLLSANLTNKTIIKLVNYLTTVIDKNEDKYYTHYINEEINALQVSDTDKQTIKIVADNALRYHRMNSTMRGSLANKWFTVERAINVNIDAMLYIINEVGAFSGIQPMSGPVSSAYSLQYISHASDSDSDTTPRMSLNVISHAVQARTQKLRAKFNYEKTSPSLTPNHDIDVDLELDSILSREVATEIFRDAFRTVCNSANKSTIKITNDDAGYKKLNINVLSASLNIARSTRRSPGNVLITGPDIISIFQKDKSFDVAPIIENADVSDLLYAGKLNNMRVYCNPQMGHDILVAYKGSNTDAGFVFLPYVVFADGGVIVSPETYVPEQRFLTRTGVLFTSGLDGANYYELITVEVDEG